MSVLYNMRAEPVRGGSEAPAHGGGRALPEPQAPRADC